MQEISDSVNLMPVLVEQQNIINQQEVETKDSFDQTGQKSNLCYKIILIIHSLTTISLVFLCFSTLIIWFIFRDEYFNTRSCPFICLSEKLLYLLLSNITISILSGIFSIIWAILKIYLLVAYKKEYKLFMIIEMIFTGLFFISSILFYFVGYVSSKYSFTIIANLSIYNYNIAVFIVNIILFNFLNLIPILAHSH